MDGSDAKFFLVRTRKITASWSANIPALCLCIECQNQPLVPVVTRLTQLFFVWVHGNDSLRRNLLDRKL